MRKRVFISAKAILHAGELPDVSTVSPLARRRLSPIQKIYFSLAAAVERTPAAAAVFASRDGEASLTARIVEDFYDDGSVSPQRFSASVYNAAPGLWSVYTRNKANYTAVAAREDSLEAGLLEALTGVLPALFVYAEETDGGYGASVVFSENEGDALSVDFRFDPDAELISFGAFSSFLDGPGTVLNGRYLKLEKTRE